MAGTRFGARASLTHSFKCRMKEANAKPRPCPGTARKPRNWKVSPDLQADG